MRAAPLLLASALCALHAAAYELDTHQDLTQRAALRSALSTGPILRDLGLDKPIGDDSQTFPNSKSAERSILLLLSDGARFEDGFTLSTSPAAIRVLQHFFDPTTRRGLSVGSFTGMASPDWILAPRGQVPGQENSYWDAREYYFKALTEPDEAVRKRNFGLAFESLGHVVHHIQDMAQPQHVRNDVHCPYFFPCQGLGIYAPSLYEAWTDQPEIRFVLPREPASVLYDITSPRYLATFGQPRQFWNTDAGGSLTGMGMAEFTNRNFVSAGTNFDTRRYALPGIDPTLTRQYSMQELCSGQAPDCPPGLAQASGRMIFFGTTGLDTFTQQEIVNPRATAWSVFNDQLTAAGATPIFTLNRFTFASGYGHLMPRAVAHSAGLINFFFRGRLDAEVSPDRADVLLVKNLAAEAMEGQFALYYDDATGTRHLLPVADCRIADAPQPVVEGRCRTTLAPAATDAAARLDFTFVFPANPPPRLEGEYVVVFTGRMGQEQPDAGARGAIAAKVLKRPPYNGALYVAGLDAANRIVTFKVDRDGLRILNGLTPDGQLRNTPPNIQLPGQKDFDPLFPIVQSFGGAVQGRLARMKQVAFDGDGAAMTHELKALAMRRKDGTFLTYTRLAPGGPFKTGGSFRWVAHDPVQGNYEFFVQTAITGLDATVFWQRQFSDTPGGPPRTTGGSFALPTFPGAFTSGVTPGNVNYHGFETGQLLVSPDGLTVSGFQDVPNINGQTFVRSLDIKITLGASPSALLVERENLASSTVLRNIVINESTSSGPGPPPEVHLVTHALNTIDRAGTRLGNRAFVDYIRGPMVTFLAETAASLLDVGANDSTIDIDFSPIVGCPQTRTDVRVNSSRFAFKSIETTTVMLDQAIVGERRDIPQFIAGNPMNWSSHGQITQIDSFPCDTDPVIGTPVRIGGDIVFDPDIVSPSPKFTGQSLVRTLNGRVDGSIISDTLLPGQSLIRGHAFPFNQEFVADASPLGEIFFATTNKSLIVYDPGRSGLPATLAIPPNIVKIVAALWL